jgi:glycosyltransferase involved in cell wall biosynthesis
LNLGLVIYGSLEQRTGGYLYDRQLVAHLRQQGDRIEVFSLPWQSYAPHLLHNLSLRIDRWARAAAFDLLLQDELNHPSLVWVNRRLRRQGLPLVSIVHHLRSSEAHRPLALAVYRSVERTYLRSVDAWVCNSYPTRDAVQALAGRPLASVVAWPGADHQRQRIQPEQVMARAREPGPLRLLFLGTITPRKGLDVLLHSLERFPRGSLRLTVVGDTDREAHFAQRMIERSRQLAVPVEFLGPVPDDRIDRLFTSHQALVVPSWHEGFGIGYLEAMGFGLVCLASASGGAADLVRHGMEGFLIPPGDHLKLAEALGLLHRDRSLLARMGLAGLERAGKHPTWQSTGAKIRDFLLDVAGPVRTESASGGLL